MFRSLRDFYRLGVAAIWVVALIDHVDGLTMQYCSTLNTGSGSPKSSIYQSNGLCQATCVNDYAFAIVKGQDCWCSDYAPGITTSTSDCSKPCPGYPDDTCGGVDTYGYIELTKSPAGTKGGAAPTSAPPTSTSSEHVTASSSSTSSSTSPGAVTIISTVTETPSTDSPEIKPTSSPAPPPTSSTPPTTVAAPKSSTSGPPASTWTPTPIVSLETITGQVRTVTVTPTSPPSSESNKPSGSKNSGGLTTGGAVGLTIGLVALMAIIAGIIFFCVRKRRQQKAEEYNSVNSRRESLAGVGVGGPIPSRTMSENSRYVLGTDGRRVVETWEPELRTPASRKSQLMPVDPRLDPFASVYQRGDNKSRESINTIRDDHDYSRRVHQQGPILRAVNPDPD
ncbi:hypothetical protein DSL72_001778 [Monilinia vaccinii-corymbosi]|uniref:WSC domain-containing protein n=1 Tax=Monilinia vaccinii-corymbosi TaxID=61207 RepID=A0A8A3PAT0_9HELO|nr:hypothetical protein DSL72_001778 [Monilinia vaccinii-corymbosi]